MDNLEKKVLETASGEHRLNPDEQRYYLGTFAERLVLVASLDEAEQESVSQHFPQILEQLQAQYQGLSLKISPNLSMSRQMTYLKEAQDQKLPATIVDETIASSPFGFVIHSDQAVYLEQIDLAEIFPQYSQQKVDPKAEKKSFWSKLFK